MQIEHPYLMFLGDAPDQLAAKTAAGVKHWRPEWCLGQFRLPGCQADLGLPDMSIPEAVTAGVRSVIVGVANRGGVIPPSWVGSLTEALEQGLDVASGLHQRLRDVPAIAEAADAHGRLLFDARHPTRTFAVADGQPRAGKRLLTVGTDCSVGKMFASLAIERAMLARGLQATFRATGQTGIFIAGDGVSVDAVVADFISGATEWLSPANDPDHWDIIEGQGSLYHPSYAGVSLGLLHGAQPDALIMCHEPTRTHMRGLPDRPVPDIKDCIGTNVGMAAMVNPAVKCVGIAINTANMDPADGDALLRATEDKLGLPCADPVRSGADVFVDALT